MSTPATAFNLTNLDDSVPEKTFMIHSFTLCLGGYFTLAMLFMFSGCCQFHISVDNFIRAVATLRHEEAIASLLYDR